MITKCLLLSVLSVTAVRCALTPDHQDDTSLVSVYFNKVGDGAAAAEDLTSRVEAALGDLRSEVESITYFGEYLEWPCVDVKTKESSGAERDNRKEREVVLRVAKTLQ